MARLNISERQIGEVTILDLSGDITFGEGNIALRTAIRRLLGDGKKKIFLDLAEVAYIDSSGVGELVSGFIAINREQGELKLVNLPPRARQLLAICKLLSIFQVCENENEALGNYA